VETIIKQLHKIPRATWIGVDPTVPPIIRPLDPVKVLRGSDEPIFDDGGFSSDPLPQWKDAFGGVSHRVVGEYGFQSFRPGKV
jgi:hypothetical protein